MKKILLSVAVLVAMTGAAMAQQHKPGHKRHVVHHRKVVHHHHHHSVRYK